MAYFIDNIKQYANVNLKGSDLQDFVSQFEHVIVEDDIALRQLRDLIKEKISELDKAYPRTKPLSFYVTGQSWSVYPKGDPDKMVLYLQYTVVRGYRSSNAQPSRS